MDQQLAMVVSYSNDYHRYWAFLDSRAAALEVEIFLMSDILFAVLVKVLI